MDGSGGVLMRLGRRRRISWYLGVVQYYRFQVDTRGMCEKGCYEGMSVGMYEGNNEHGKL